MSATKPVSEKTPTPHGVPGTPMGEGEWFGHPKGLFVLFFAELWERFSFYGMRGLLVLYLVKGLSFGDGDAKATYGAYLGFVYFTPLIGGMLADRFLGYRRAIITGGFLMVAGQFLMMYKDPQVMTVALGLIIAGNGFFKPNISALVSKLYPANDPRRDSAFTIFYMGINIGAFTAPLACGALGEKFDWQYGFGLAGVGMIIGQLVFMSFLKQLGPHGLPPRPEALNEKVGGFLPKTWLVYLGVLLFVPVAATAMHWPNYLIKLNLVAGGVFFVYMLFEAFRCTPVERDRIIVAMTLAAFSIVFWACFEQAGSSLTLFADTEIDRTVSSWTIPVSWFQSVNPIFIVMLGIPFAAMWSTLERRNRAPSAPVKFALGLFQLALGFLVLAYAARISAGEGGIKASFWWLVLGYFLHTTGELCVSPVGLSSMTKLAPARLTGLMMGFWFLCASLAGALSGLIAKLTGEGEGGYVDTFDKIVWLGIIAGVVMLILSPLLKKMSHGVH